MKYNRPMAGDASCVYCLRRAADPEWAPFCSERCRMADLWRWLAGEYRVPGRPGTEHHDDDDDDRDADD